MTGEPMSFGFIELARDWPDDTTMLALDPGTPVEALLPPGLLQDMAEFGARPSSMEEEALSMAVEDEDAEGYLRLLMDLEVAVPVDPAGGESRDLGDPEFPWWRPAGPAGPIGVFSSVGRLRDVLGAVPFVEVEFTALTMVWPEAAPQLVVDAGLPFGGMLPGEALRHVGVRVSRAGRAAERALNEVNSRTELTAERAQAFITERIQAGLDDPAFDAEPSAEVPVVTAGVAVQVVLPIALVDRLLTQGHDRVAGLIHRKPPQPRRLQEQYRELGLLGDGSPFGADDADGYVVRWVEPDPGAYPVPTMDGVPVPEGAGLWRVTGDGAEQQIAVYRSARWTQVTG
jgi:hypothetical protein